MDSDQIRRRLRKMQDMTNLELEWITACVKCGKGGNVLVCNGCPIVVHKSCISCPARFDSAGNFNCPYCLYKQSVEELNTARNNLLKARRAISRFPDGTAVENKGCDELKVQGAKRTMEMSLMMDLQEEDGRPERMKKKQKAGDGRPVRRIENDDDECNLGSDVSKKSLDHEVPPASLVIEKPETTSSECIFVEESGKTMAQYGSNIRSVDNQKRSDSDNHVNMCSAVGDKEPHTAPGVVGISQTCISLGEVGGEKMLYDNCLQEDGTGDGGPHLDAISNDVETGGEEAPLAFDLLQKNQEIKQVNEERPELEEMVTSTRHGDGEQSEMVLNDGGEEMNCKKTGRGGGVGRSPSNEWEEILGEHAKLHIQRRVTSKYFKQPVGGHCQEEPNGMEQFEFEDSLVASDSDMEVAKVPTTRGHSAASSDGKRKKLRWTSEEVEMLTQAVVMFSSNPRKNYPWRKMLDFGRNVFDETRTPNDLKDKWKLILKREAKRRKNMMESTSG